MSNMVINTNVQALNSHRALKSVGNAQSKASTRLSSGLKINSAADDAAGLAISEKMRAQIRGLDMASKNSQDAISLIQTAEGGMQEIDNMLQRIRELITQASNDTNENNSIGTGDRQKMQAEIEQLVSEIDSMAERVEFNKKKVINGDYADPTKEFDSAYAKYEAASKARGNGITDGTKKTLIEAEEVYKGKVPVITGPYTKADFQTVWADYKDKSDMLTAAIATGGSLKAAFDAAQTALTTAPNSLRTAAGTYGTALPTSANDLLKMSVADFDNHVAKVAQAKVMDSIVTLPGTSVPADLAALKLSSNTDEAAWATAMEDARALVVAKEAYLTGTGAGTADADLNAYYAGIGSYTMQDGTVETVTSLSDMEALLTKMTANGQPFTAGTLASGYIPPVPNPPGSLAGPAPGADAAFVTWIKGVATNAGLLADIASEKQTALDAKINPLFDTAVGAGGSLDTEATRFATYDGGGTATTAEDGAVALGLITGVQTFDDFVSLADIKSGTFDEAALKAALDGIYTTATGLGLETGSNVAMTTTYAAQTDWEAETLANQIAYLKSVNSGTSSTDVAAFGNALDDVLALVQGREAIATATTLTTAEAQTATDTAYANFFTTAGAWTGTPPTSLPAGITSATDITTEAQYQSLVAASEVPGTPGLPGNLTPAVTGTAATAASASITPPSDGGTLGTLEVYNKIKDGGTVNGVNFVGEAAFTKGQQDILKQKISDFDLLGADLGTGGANALGSAKTQTIVPKGADITVVSDLNKYLSNITLADFGNLAAATQAEKDQISAFLAAGNKASHLVELADTGAAILNTDLGNLVNFAAAAKDIVDAGVDVKNAYDDYYKTNKKAIETALGTVQTPAPEVNDKAEFNKAYAAANKANNEAKAVYDKAKAADELNMSKLDIAQKQMNNAQARINNMGSVQPGLYFQVGANAKQGLQITIGSIKSDILGIGDGNGKTFINVLKNSGTEITGYLDLIDESLSYVTTERSELGAAQNRLEYTIRSLDISSENLASAESRIRDTDMAKEMMNLTKSNVLQQAATSMLAQANQGPQNILQLLR